MPAEHWHQYHWTARILCALTLGERAHEGTEVIRLLESTLADLDDVRQILADLREQLAANATLTEEETVERVGMLSTLLFQSMEVL